MNSKEIARLACEAMEDKKAQDINDFNILCFFIFHGFTSHGR